MGHNYLVFPSEHQKIIDKTLRHLRDKEEDEHERPCGKTYSHQADWQLGYEEQPQNP